MQDLQPTLRSGLEVDVRGEPWLVVHTEAFAQVTVVTLRGVGADNLGDTARLLTPFDTVDVARRGGLVRRSRRRVLERAALSIAESTPWTECWTAAAADIDLRQWQLEPVRAVIGGASRLLLADAVGLGKTIQALLVVCELLARGLARRVLVLTPASLREQWAREMSGRFGLTAAVFDQPALAGAAATLPPEVNPWQTASVVVSSIDLVKRSEVRTAIDAVAYDILVVDEAHHLTPGSDRGAVVADLAARTPWIVLLTATPHSGDDAAYRFLCRLGAIDESTDPVVFARTAAEVGVRGPRRERFLKVAVTDAERALLSATRAYAKAVWGGPDPKPHARLVASVIARRAASSARAAWRTLTRRLALIEGNAVPDRQPILPWHEPDDDDDEVPDALLAVAGLLDSAEERALLRRLIALADSAAASSSKARVLRALLRRTTERVIVFSEYRDAIAMLADALADVTTLAVLHGGMSASERGYAIRSFAAGRVRALLATDAAGEGLNLQENCRLVVNLELPWNPLRLEQRIGRVDRLGQVRRVHAIHLVHDDSFEGDVRARLEQRRETVAAQRGGGGVGAIVGAAHTERRLRAIATKGLARPDVGRATYAADRRPGGASVVLLFISDLTDLSGRRVERAAMPLCVQIEGRSKRWTRLSKATVRRLARDRTVLAVLETGLSARATATNEAVAPVAEALERRATSLLAAIARRGGEQRYQGSLFDRRAEQKAHAGATARAAWTSALERQAMTAGALRSLAPSEPRLVAAWLQ